MRDDEAGQSLRTKAALEAANAWGSKITAIQAENVADLHRVHPHMGAVAVPLGVAGVRPTDATAIAASKAEAQRKLAKPIEGSIVSGGLLKSLGSHILNDGLKPVVRYGFAGAQFPIELINAGAREGLVEAGVGHGQGYSLGDPTRLLRQTTVGAGVAEAHDRGQLGSMLLGRGDEALAGDGWFINPVSSITGERQAREARKAGMIDNHALTVGRASASALFDPGSTAYNVTSGIVDTIWTIGADPTTYLTGGASTALKARAVIGAGATRELSAKVLTPEFLAAAGGKSKAAVAQGAGMVEGTRPMVLPEKAADFLESGQGDKIADTYVGITDHNTLNRMTKGKFPLALRIGLLDATSRDEVKGLLAKGIMDGAVRDMPGVKVTKPTPRLLANMPEAQARISEPEKAIENLDRWQRSVAHLVGEDVISKNNEDMARALIAHNHGEVKAVATRTATIVSHALQANGVSKTDADAMTRLWGEESDRLHSYGVDDIGRALDFPGAHRNADGVAIPSSHLMVEALDDVIPLPNVRDLKTAARQWHAMRAIEQNTGVKVVVSALDAITGTLFKTLALAVRPAWAVRVVGEEVLARLTGAGLASPINHPASYMSIVAGVKPGSKLSKALRAAPGVHNAMGEDLLGRAVMDHAVKEHFRTDFGRALNHGSGGWGRDDYGRALSGRWDAMQKGTRDYPTAMVHEAIKLSAEPWTKFMAQGGTLRQAQSAFWDGGFADFRRMMVEGGNTDITQRAFADEYIRTTWERLNKFHSEHPELKDAVANNTLRGEQVTDGFHPNPKAVKHMRQLLKDNPEVGPQYVSGPISLSAKDNPGALAYQKMNAGFDALWHVFGTLPTNRFSRSVAYQQFYYNRAEELLPMMTPRARSKMIAQAEKIRLGSKRVARLKQAVADSPAGTLTLKDADFAAGHYALAETKNLLYDLHEKGQWADALRIAVPFGEAQREVLTRWAQLSAQNPRIPYRVGQGIRQLVEPGSGTIYDLTGTPHPDEPGNSGFFYTDEFGQERFAYPGSQLLTKIAGDPGGFTAPVSGLNMIGNLAPGAGPVVSLTASKVTWKQADWQWLRKQIMPYGDPDTGSGFLEAFLPSYASKIRASLGIHPSPTQQKALASSTVKIAAQLLSTGDYDVSTTEGKDHLLEDAQHRATLLYFIRGIAQSTLPSAPSPQAMAKDKTGQWTFQYLMAQDYQAMLKDPDIGPAGADAAFVDKWGSKALLSIVSTSTSDNAFTPTSKAYQLRLKHPDVARKFPHTFGLFTPDPDHYSSEEQNAEIKAGQRTPLGNSNQHEAAAQALSIASQRAAQVIYEQARAKLPEHLNPNQNSLLSDLKGALEREYPGYDPEYKGSPTHGRILELVQASHDPVLAKTDAGQGLTTYLKIRDAAEARARTEHLGDWLSTKRAAPLRNLVREGATAVIQEHPDFADMWSRVLSRELSADK